MKLCKLHCIGMKRGLWVWQRGSVKYNGDEVPEEYV